MILNYQRMIEREERRRMRINGEPIVGITSLNRSTVVFTPTRTYSATVPLTLKSRIIGGINRFWLKVRRIYGI